MSEGIEAENGRLTIKVNYAIQTLVAIIAGFGVHVASGIKDEMKSLNGRVQVLSMDIARFEVDRERIVEIRRRLDTLEARVKP